MITYRTNIATTNKEASFLLTSIILCSTVSGGISPSYGGSREIQIVQSDRNGVTVLYEPQFRTPSRVPSPGQEFVRYDFEGAVVSGRPLPGEPELRVRRIPLRLPDRAGNSVEILKADYEDIPNVTLLPVAGLHPGELDPVRSYAPDRAAYSRTEFLPGRIATLENVGESRRMILGDLTISPMQYNAGLRTLRKYTRILVRVNFGGEGAAAASNDPMARGLALNEAAFSSTLSGSPGRRAATLRNSVLSSGVWYRFPIAADGVYKLTGQALLNAGIPSGTDPKTIRIFGNGGFELPAAVTAPSADDLIENAVYTFDGGSQGALDPGDYVAFYAKGVRGWTYNPATRSFSHYINHFTETDYCWLTYGNTPAKAMAVSPSLNQPGVPAVTTILGMESREDDRVNLLSSGQEWLGPPMSNGEQATYVTSLPGLDNSQQISYRFHVGAQSHDFSTFAIKEHGVQLGANVILSGTDVGNDLARQLTDAVLVRSIQPAFSDGQSQLRFAYSTSNVGGTGYVDWYEIFYRRKLQAQNDLFNFRAQDTSAAAGYDVTGFSGGPVLVFDVTKFDSAVFVSGPRVSADTCSFQVQLAAGSAKEFYAVGANGFKTPGQLSRVPNQNLHGDPAEADYIIVTHPDFDGAAQRLRTFREQQAPNPLRSLVVDVDDIYNEFGGGLPSPVAIRNYLRYVYSNWSRPPKYLLLFGDGDYDYRRIVATGPDWIPAWETVESFDPLGTYASDDDFAILDNNVRVDLGVGRLTVRSAQEANTVVDKIVEYETNPVEDPWKIRATFVADDALAGVLPNGTIENDGTQHMDQAEDVARRIPPLFDVKKIYEFEYPTVFTPEGRRKPGVTAAIIDQVNQGTMIMNFSGHGNPQLWTHEHCLVNATDFPQFHNKGKYFFLVAATCNFSAFDQLDQQSGGELLQTMPGAGAIATFSATRPVFQSLNATLNVIVFQNLFQLDSAGRVLPQRLGDVVYRAKQIRTTDNDRKYFLLGDPALSIAFPRLYASVDSINHQPASLTAQLQALSHAAVTATVRDTASSGILPVSGQAQIVVNDAQGTIQLTDPDAGLVTFRTEGSVLFRGAATLNNGTISSTFVVPKDISYRNDFGRITTYFWNGSTDGAGYTANVRVGGSDSAAVPDSTGPLLRLYLDSRGFRPGDIVSATPLFIADLSDVSGINTSGSGVGHRLEAWLDDQPESIDLSAFYQSKTDTYQEGTVEYRFGTLPAGSHKLRMRAWDTYNNSTMTETIFSVLEGAGLDITNVYNYPNPFSSTTLFTFEQSQVSGVDAEVKIYTVAGRMIQSLKKANLNEHFVQIPWDGRDRDGDLLANGVYLYKLIARTQDGRFSKEVLGKLSIIR
ncbi:MAG TPA: type IX secretion system sortase PorU [Bacteroidota bacterium]